MEEKKEFEQEMEQEEAVQEEMPAEETGDTDKEQEEAGASSEAQADPEEGQDASEQASGPGEKKGFFKKREKKDKKDEQIAELTDKVKRQLAEFENFRNRTEKEKSSMFEIGAKSVIEKILPIVDNFERGLSGLSKEEKEAPFAAGMQMVYKQLLTELDNLGVKPIEAVGREFDPNLHNAVMQVESEEFESGVVAQEMMKGYTYRDSVVRHSMVAVVS